MLCLRNAKSNSDTSLAAGSSCGGFTLVEVMVATVLSLVIFMGGYGALAQGYKLVEASRDETRASQILQSEIEDLRTYDWATLEGLPETYSYSPQSSFTTAYSDRYLITRGIQSLTDTQRVVRVRVDWLSNGGSPHSREYQTMITKGGLYDYYYRSF